MKHRKLAIVTIMLLLVVLIGSLAACKPAKKFDNEKSPLILSTGELDGVFSSFFASSSYDSSVAGMTQIGMLGVDNKGKTDYGDEIPAVARYVNDTKVDDRTKSEQDRDARTNTYYTTYDIVIKNGIKFADGEPLTYKDVLFNLYLYLDPVYNGSGTMYSTDIFGLSEYRTQDAGINESEFDEDMNRKAYIRLSEFLAYYNSPSQFPTTYEESDLKSDFEYLKNEFKVELNSDWSMFASSIETYEKEYTSVATGKKLVTETWQAFLVGWNTVEITLDKDLKYGTDPNKVVSINFSDAEAAINDIKAKNKKASKARIQELIKEYCVNKVYANYFGSSEEYTEAIFREKSQEFLGITSTGSSYINYIANLLKSEFLNRNSAGGLQFPTISGITVREIKAGEKFIDNNKDAIKVENDEGELVNKLDDKGNKLGKEYEMDEDHYILSIKIHGVDPKALINFGFTVAPLHYYSNPQASTSRGNYAKNLGYSGFKYDFEENRDCYFGFPYANIDYMNDVIKGVQGLPMGAGTYVPTNAKSQDFSKVKALGSNEGFFDSNIVYFMRNPYFYTTAKSENVQNAKIRLMRYAVTNTNRLLDSVKTENVHFADPAADETNWGKITNDTELSFVRTLTNGYGYIGINAKFVPDINIRRAIMYAMNTSLVNDYYPGDLSEEIYYPISKASWAYPENVTSPHYNSNDAQGKFSDAIAKEKIRALMKGYVLNSNGEYTNGKNKLVYTFTIAGGSSEHPAYRTMVRAAELLKDLGFKIKVITDPFALRKLSTGKLTVWAAAWNASIDPDMYQVYHKDSKASALLAWGYPSILGKGVPQTGSGEEVSIINTLSDLIEEARKTTNQDERIELYEKALYQVMELAVELPTYQRNDITVYKHSIIEKSSLVPESECSPFYGVLSRIWEVSFTNQ